MDGLQTTGPAYWQAEIGRLADDNVRLATDNARLEAEDAALRIRVGELEGQISALTEKVTTLAKLVFGTSLEKSKPAEPERGRGDVTGEKSRRGQQPGSPGHDRRDNSTLETVEEIHDLVGNERICAECGAPYAAFGEETSYQIDWQVRIV